MKKSSPRLHSLRKRAIFFSALISLLIVMVTVFGYINFKNIHNESSLNLIKRHQFLEHINLIRTELLDSYKELNNFLLEPESINYQKSIIVSVKEALSVSNQLNKHSWLSKYNRRNIAVELNEKILSLNKEVVNLIKVRLDINNQYPSLAVGSEIMQPNRNALNNAIALAMNEMVSDNTQIENPEVFSKFIQVRHLWTQVLSNFRLYLANRVGSFNENSLPVQEKGIETAFAQLQFELQKLKKIGDAGKLGFETTDAVETMLSSLNGWFDGFKKVKIINHSDEWRQDAKIMKERISPLIDSIIELLTELEEVTTESSINDVNLIASLGDSQNRILWGIAIIGILFTAAIIMSLDKLIFHPIALISKALKLEAMGKQSETVAVVNAEETEDLVNAFNEMSRQVHVRQTELEYRALHDSLTSLPNRALLLDRIEHDTRIAKRESQTLSLLILDLDNFKEVNDTLGHVSGDSLLIEVGKRILNKLRDVDTIARIGGDEFAILLPNTNEEQASMLGEKVLSSFEDVIKIDDVDVSVSASIGVAMYPEHGEDADTLLRHADIAMYVAKRNKLGIDFYNEEKDNNSVTRLSMSRDFRDALANDKLTLNFQPVFDIESKNIVAVEALSRWHHPEHGFVSPEKFILLAEKMGLINNLTYQVLDKSIAQVSRWNQQGHSLSVAVNISVYSLKDPGFISEARSVLSKYDLPGDKLKLEITESAMMDNPLRAIEILSELNKMGIKLSIDDFGTGFSSMAYLKQLPVDELKIDKSFIFELDEDDSNDAIVRSTIELAHNLGLNVVAEGIETEKVFELLRTYKCNHAQGFHLGRPVTAEIFEKDLLNRSNQGLIASM